MYLAINGKRLRHLQMYFLTQNVLYKVQNKSYLHKIKIYIHIYISH